MNCPHCKAPLAADARFCPACGKATAPTESGASWPAAAVAQPDLVGREIAGRYRILAKLGEGGMGAVYRGEQISLKRAVAVKLLRPELGSNQMILRRFNAEAEAVAKLSHPNTVNIYDFGQDSDGSLFIAMEFVEGQSLREALQRSGPFAPARAIAIALQVAASLTDAHSHSIVHRDLKPDNVMLQDRGRQKDVVRVLDFGIAKLRDDSRATQQAMTQAGDMLGTPQYMAPEQIRGERVDGRVDIYALGCMIYEMVTGRLPYEAPSIMAMLSKHLLENPVPPTQRRPDLALPPAIDQLVLSAMAKDPNARPATMEQFAEHLAALLATLPADPNRSAALSVQQGIAAASPTPPPMGFVPTGPPPGVPMFPPPGPPPPMAAGYPQGPPPGVPMPMAPQMPPPPIAHAPTPPPMVGGFPSTTPAPFGQAAQPAPPPPAPAKSSRAPLYIVLGVLALGGAGAGIWFATRGDNKSAAAGPTPSGGTSNDPWADKPGGRPADDDPAVHDPPDPDTDDDPDVPDPPDPPAPAGDDPWADKNN